MVSRGTSGGGCPPDAVHLYRHVVHPCRPCRPPTDNSLSVLQLSPGMGGRHVVSVCRPCRPPMSSTGRSSTGGCPPLVSRGTGGVLCLMVDVSRGTGGVHPWFHVEQPVRLRPGCQQFFNFGGSARTRPRRIAACRVPQETALAVRFKAAQQKRGFHFFRRRIHDLFSLQDRLRRARLSPVHTHRSFPPTIRSRVRSVWEITSLGCNNPSGRCGGHNLPMCKL